MTSVTTTNVLLGVLALISVVEALAIVAVLVGGFVMLRRLARTLSDMETRHIAPATTRIADILKEISDATSALTRNIRAFAQVVQWGTRWASATDPTECPSSKEQGRRHA
jgi:hypothetical protein